MTVYGDAISDKTGLGGNWIGFLLIGIVTSVPELASGISAVTLADAPGLAVGAIFGACIFNLGIIVVLDLLYRRGSIYTSASQGHILSAAFGIVMISFSGSGMNLALNGDAFAFGHIGVHSPIILVLYLVAVYTVFSYESGQIKIYTEQDRCLPEPFAEYRYHTIHSRRFNRYSYRHLVADGRQANCPDHALARKFCRHLVGCFHHYRSGNGRCSNGG